MSRPAQTSQASPTSRSTWEPPVRAHAGCSPAPEGSGLGNTFQSRRAGLAQGG